MTLKVLVIGLLATMPLMAAKTGKKITVDEQNIHTPVNMIKKTTIEGQAFLKTRGGDVKTCAGEDLVLLELSDYNFLVKSKMKSTRLHLDLNDKMAANIHCDVFKECIPFTANDESKYLALIEEYPEAHISFSWGQNGYESAIYKAMQAEEERFKILKQKNILSTQCDMNGNFILKNIPYGKYALVTSVTWTNGENIQGGEVGKEIIVDDKLQKVFITDQIPNK
jgi:hypothetical protein